MLLHSLAQLSDVEAVLLRNLGDRLVDFGIGQLDPGAVGSRDLQLQHDQAIEHLAFELGARRQLLRILRVLRGHGANCAIELAAQDHVLVEHGYDVVERNGRYQLRMGARHREEQGQGGGCKQLVHARRSSGNAANAWGGGILAGGRRTVVKISRRQRAGGSFRAGQAPRGDRSYW